MLYHHQYDVEKPHPLQLIVPNCELWNMILVYLVSDLFLFCYEREFLMSLSDKQADVIDAFNTTSRYLDDILNINNVYFDS